MKRPMGYAAIAVLSILFAGMASADPVPPQLIGTWRLVSNTLEEFERQFDRLYAEGGRVMCITVHPALVGQAQRAKYIDAALRYVASSPNVWFATGRDIADYYLTHCYDGVIERLSTWENA
jgi:hypothetical protein